MPDVRQDRPFRVATAAFVGILGKTITMKLAIAVIFCVTLGFLGVASAQAADFRVENKVFSGSDKKPCLQSTTIFTGGFVYDYLVDPENPDDVDEVTIFDFARERFTLLDMRLKLRSELSAKLVKAAVDSLKTRKDLGNDPFVGFLINPNFNVDFNEESGELLFASQWLDYRIIVQAAQSPEIAEDYRRFSDWCARLNAYIRPGARPPFARLLVNEELGKRGELPREVHLTLKPKQGLLGRNIRSRSEHAVTPRLGEGDRRRVAKTAGDLAAFQAVGFDEYNKKRAEFQESR